MKVKYYVGQKAGPFIKVYNFCVCWDR